MGKRAVACGGGIAALALVACSASRSTSGPRDLSTGGGPDMALLFGDPTTCAQAADYHSYVGCDYWPTVVANPVWSIFDFAVVVSNPGASAADVTVTGPVGTSKSTTVPPNALVKIYLPWVPELKGGDCDACGNPPPLTASVLKTGGAFHLVSTAPVIVYQFNALEYKGLGGPPGKNWGTCPGTITTCPMSGAPIGCFSFTNDASLLLPSTAMTGNYRVVTAHGLGVLGGAGLPGYFAITATQDATNVRVKLSVTGDVVAGSGISATAAANTLTLTLNAGDVAELVSQAQGLSDQSGSLVAADKPVQVISGSPCYPNPTNACDHMEESVLPAETLGNEYVVVAPAGPNGAVVPQTIRFVGNVDGTKLTYDPPVSGVPPTLDAGEVQEIDSALSFHVLADHEFAVYTVSKSASVVDPGALPPNQKGDPALSAAVAVAQYRTKYVFLAPQDYDVNYADIVAPAGASLTVDGSPAVGTPMPIGSTSFRVIRIPLAGGSSGAHVISSDQAIGIQVEGYGSYTSYQYPAGLNLSRIAPPPVL